jgi:hypothetical protein
VGAGLRPLEVVLLLEAGLESECIELGARSGATFPELMAAAQRPWGGTRTWYAALRERGANHEQAMALEEVASDASRGLRHGLDAAWLVTWAVRTPSRSEFKTRVQLAEAGVSDGEVAELYDRVGPRLTRTSEYRRARECECSHVQALRVADDDGRFVPDAGLLLIAHGVPEALVLAWCNDDRSMFRALGTRLWSSAHDTWMDPWYSPLRGARMKLAVALHRRRTESPS